VESPDVGGLCCIGVEDRDRDRPEDAWSGSTAADGSEAATAEGGTPSGSGDPASDGVAPTTSPGTDDTPGAMSDTAR